MLVQISQEVYLRHMDEIAKTYVPCCTDNLDVLPNLNYLYGRCTHAYNLIRIF